jgi:hypothetical protein
MHLIRHLCHIFSEIVESQRHAYLNVILQQLGENGGFFSRRGNCNRKRLSHSLAGKLYGSVRPGNDNRKGQIYKTHLFFDIKKNLGILVTVTLYIT